MAKPAAPQRKEPTKWKHFQLWTRVREAIRSAPDHFATTTNIEGMLASDIFTLNAALAATIEEQVVQTLNAMRPVWDPDKAYQTYAFVRQPQTFPDVILRRTENGPDILMGIELKGWYLLAREGMPNFRFTVSPTACNEWDLIVVMPWVLSNVLSGSPILFQPFLELARFAAEQRNYYWQYERATKADAGVILAKGVGPYPVKSDQISDRPVSDSGGNFGRLARYGIMGDYVSKMLQRRLRGIPVRQWLEFFKSHAEPQGEIT